MRVLVLNSGSSSQKSALFELRGAVSPDPQLPLWEAKIEWNQGSAVLRVRNSRGTKTDKEVSVGDRQGAIERMLETLWTGETGVLKGSSEIEVVGHRIVHGGERFRTPMLVDDVVTAELENLGRLAPLHNPPALAAIRRAREVYPQTVHVAVFDTAYHATLPDRAREYALPGDLRRRFGIRRYGFHGISHAHVMHAVVAELRVPAEKLRIVSCHLGNGASVTAIEHGRSIDTSMGMTPLEGLVMGTRAGDLDPGILLDLIGSRSFGGKCLTARRLIERGVRFVQVYSDGEWDAHADLAGNHTGHCAATDVPIHGLLTDLKRRGLFDSTLVIWGGEFGRMPVSQGANGRDHNPKGFLVWMAGAGIRGGASHGETDEIGYRAAVDPVTVHDLHATMLHLLGVDHEKLTYLHNGRNYRLTDVAGNVLTRILA